MAVYSDIFQKSIECRANLRQSSSSWFMSISLLHSLKRLTVLFTTAWAETAKGRGVRLGLSSWLFLSLSKRTTLCVQSLLIYFCVRWCKRVSIHPFASISANYGPKPQIISANGYLEQTKAVNWSAWKTVFVLFATNFFQPPLSATSSFRYCKQHYNSRFPSSCPRYM